MNTTVNFELARLLFDKKCELVNIIPADQFSVAEVISPTIADVCMWIYEKHGIWINVSPVFEFNEGREDYLTLLGHQYYITVITDNKYNQEKTHADRGCVNTPTEAYLKAIEYVLNNLI